MKIIIIGAGVAGLTAARKLSQEENSITVIEARDRIGGRIHTLREKTFSRHVEAGAEFIHGDLKLTKELLNEAKIPFRKGEGRMWNVFDGKVEEGDFFSDGWDELIRKLKALKEDIPIAEFLRRNFSDPKYDELRQSIEKFVSGYDAADPEKASSFALRDEWTSDEDITGYHPEGGYGRAIDFLKAKCDTQHVIFHLSEVVFEIEWKEGYVKVNTTSGHSFEGEKVLITIPPAVIKSGVIKFTPEIPDQQKAIEKIETGGVIKFLVEFNEAYWEERDPDFRSFPGLHFLFSDAIIPTWWTSMPDPTPLLTGWLAGPILEKAKRSEAQLFSDCYDSLAYLFNTTDASLKKKIRSIRIIDWKSDPYACGAYAYRTVHSNEVSARLSKPVADTLYFAGEAYYNGPEMGTVEAALGSANDVVKLMR